MFSTGGEIDFTDFTRQVEEVVRKSGVKNGLVHVFAPPRHRHSRLDRAGAESVK